MDMEVPKNYSNVYCEERAPVPATRATTAPALPMKISLDGSFSIRRHKELAGGINPYVLSQRLQYHLSKEQHKAYAMNTLQQHYNSVFQKRNKQKKFKVYIGYWDLKETYLVSIDNNLLREVKSKLPLKGDYRLFFVHPGNECEEVEDDDGVLPYREREGQLIINCRVFAK